MKNGIYIIFRFKKALALISTITTVVSFLILIKFSYPYTDVVQTAINNDTIIIIDPGHGGEDGGTQSETGILEKDINLSVSLKIRDKLSEMGYTTVMTREDDSLIYDEGLTTMREKKKSDIYNRMEIMNSYQNPIFLSVHQNYFTESRYNGAQVFYSKNNSESKVLATEIQTSIRESLQPENNRQIKESTDDVYLLDKAEKIAVMVECGFMSNPEEATKLNDEDYQDKISAAIVDGLVSYLKIKSEGETLNGTENKKYLRLQ